MAVGCFPLEAAVFVDVFQFQPVGVFPHMASRRRESHPPPLLEPCVTLSRHTAPDVEPDGSAPCLQWTNMPW